VVLLHPYLVRPLSPFFVAKLITSREYITWSVIYSPETMLSTTYVESVFTAIITTSVVSIYATNSAAASG
jgi:hypothetical protein